MIHPGYPIAPDMPTVEVLRREFVENPRSSTFTVVALSMPTQQLRAARGRRALIERVKGELSVVARLAIWPHNRPIRSRATSE